MANRVVITGIGVISSIGIGKETFWQNLIAGKSGVSQVSSFDTSGFPTHNGAEVKEPLPERYLYSNNGSSIDHMGRASKMAICAARMAMEDAHLKEAENSINHTGIVIGTTMAESQNIEAIDETWVTKGESFIETVTCQQYPAHNISSNVAKALNLQCENLVIPCACAAGNFAIGYAYDQLRLGRANIMIAGGVDAFSRIAYVGFNRLMSMAQDRCAPFDKNRKGIILGEGAGIFVLERLEDAQKRSAPVYAEILGYGLSCDAYHMTVPQFGGIITAIFSALKASDVNPEDIDYINAHGTGTPANDRAECLSLKKIFKDRLPKIPVSSSKSMLGHTMGAASAIEAIACALAIKHDKIPPTINYEIPDPDCDIDCVPNVSREHEVNIALNNGFAFGGNNACLVLKKCNLNPYC